MKGRTDKWSLDEENLVINQIDVLHREPNQVVVADRTQRAIDHKISELRKEGRLKSSFYVEWTDEEDGMLLVQIGMQLRNLKEVFIPGRTEQSIYARIKKLRKKGFRIAPIKCLRPQQITARLRRLRVIEHKKELRSKVSKLKKVLNGIGRYWPSAVVAGVLLCKQDYVSRWRKRRGLPLDHVSALQDPIYCKNFSAQVSFRSGHIKSRHDVDLVVSECVSDALLLMPGMKALARKDQNKKKQEERERQKTAKKLEKLARIKDEKKNTQNTVTGECVQDHVPVVVSKNDLPIRKPVASEKILPSTREDAKRRDYEHKCRIGVLEQKFHELSSRHCMSHFAPPCPGCGKHWYLTRDFFPIVKKENILVLGDICRACMNIMLNKT